MIRLVLLLFLMATWGVGQSARLAEQRIGPRGGALQLPGIQVVVPSGALVSSVRFRLERLKAVPSSPPQDEVFFIQTLRERELVGIYRLSSSATNFLRPIEIELRVNPLYRPGGRVIRSVVYAWDGEGYVSTQVPSTREFVTLTRLELGLGAGSGGYPAGLVLVVLRAPEESLRRECQARGGRWTGSSCERR